MNMIIPFLIGVVVGAAILYFLQMKDMERLDQLETELKKARRDLAEAEADHEQRLKEAIATLQEDYQEKQDRRILNLKTEYQTKINVLESQLGIASPKASPSVSELTQQPSLQLPTTPRPLGDAPILAAEIQYRPERPAILMAIPTGKPSEPPILAQGLASLPPTTAIAQPVSAEPPILAADIQYCSERPAILLATPTGKPSEPPILAQGIASVPSVIVTEPETDNLSPAAIPLTELAQNVFASDRQTRITTAQAIATLLENNAAAVPQALPPLTQLSQDEDPQVRQAAVVALGQIKAAEVIPLLEQRLHDSDPDVVAAASAALNHYKTYPVNSPNQPAPKPIELTDDV